MPTTEYQGAEMLYLIVMASQADDLDARDAIKADSIGDVDEDGMPEFVDGWRQPICFLRWAPGFISDLHVVARGNTDFGSYDFWTKTIVMVADADRASFSSTPGSYVGGVVASQGHPYRPNAGREHMERITGYRCDAGQRPTFVFQMPIGTSRRPFADGSNNFNGSFGRAIFVFAPDPFDPFGVYPEYPSGSYLSDPDMSRPSYAIYPLIYSAGSDRCYGVHAQGVEFLVGVGYPEQINYRARAMNPFLPSRSNQMIGTQIDDAFEKHHVPSGWVDNIHNHQQGRK
jgi:hypothetical protein